MSRPIRVEFAGAVYHVMAGMRLGGERGVDLARVYGYQDGSGVRQVVKRLEAAAKSSRPLARKLERLHELSTASQALTP